MKNKQCKKLNDLTLTLTTISKQERTLFMFILQLNILSKSTKTLFTMNTTTKMRRLLNSIQQPLKLTNMNTTTISYKDVFELACTKGYKQEFNVTLEQIEINSQFGADYPEEGRYIDLCLIQKWLRDEHKIEAISLPYTMSADSPEKKYIWMIHKVKSSTAISQYFDTYEQALMEGINAALQLI